MVAAEPFSWPTAIAILIEARQAGTSISTGMLEQMVDTVIACHAPVRQVGEVAWALWASIAFGLRLSDESARLVSGLDDNVVALLAFDAADKAVFGPGQLDPSRWEKLSVDGAGLRDENWLLAYEADLHGWIPQPAVAQHPLFSALRKAGISFYDRRADRDTIPAAAMAAPGGDLDWAYF